MQGLQLHRRRKRNGLRSRRGGGRDDGLRLQLPRNPPREGQGQHRARSVLRRPQRGGLPPRPVVAVRRRGGRLHEEDGRNGSGRRRAQGRQGRHGRLRAAGLDARRGGLGRRRDRRPRALLPRDVPVDAVVLLGRPFLVRLRREGGGAVPRGLRRRRRRRGGVLHAERGLARVRAPRPGRLGGGAHPLRREGRHARRAASGPRRRSGLRRLRGQREEARLLVPGRPFRRSRAEGRRPRRGGLRRRRRGRPRRLHRRRLEAGLHDPAELARILDRLAVPGQGPAAGSEGLAARRGGLRRRRRRRPGRLLGEGEGPGIPARAEQFALLGEAHPGLREQGGRRCAGALHRPTRRPDRDRGPRALALRTVGLRRGGHVRGAHGGRRPHRLRRARLHRGVRGGGRHRDDGPAGIRLRQGEGAPSPRLQARGARLPGLGPCARRRHALHGRRDRPRPRGRAGRHRDAPRDMAPGRLPRALQRQRRLRIGADVVLHVGHGVRPALGGGLLPPRLRLPRLEPHGGRIEPDDRNRLEPHGGGRRLDHAVRRLGAVFVPGGLRPERRKRRDGRADDPLRRLGRAVRERVQAGRPCLRRVVGRAGGGRPLRGPGDRAGPRHRGRRLGYALRRLDAVELHGRLQRERRERLDRDDEREDRRGGGAAVLRFLSQRLHAGRLGDVQDGRGRLGARRGRAARRPRHQGRRHRHALRRVEQDAAERRAVLPLQGERGRNDLHDYARRRRLRRYHDSLDAGRLPRDGDREERVRGLQQPDLRDGSVGPHGNRQ